MAAFEENGQGGGDPKWGSYENLHKELKGFSVYCHHIDLSKLSTPPQVDDFFHRQVCATEKLDGSNLSIRAAVSKDTGSWEVLEILGRKKPLWTKSDDAAPLDQLPKYGNAGSLGKLHVSMLAFAAKLGSMLGLTDIAIYGEAFRVHSKIAYTSWHPFGYKNPQDGWMTHRLTSGVYDLFQKVAYSNTGESEGLCPPPPPPPPHSHDAFFSFLREHGTRRHLITPPPLLSVGKLSEVIDTLHPLMLEARLRKIDQFEGCFLVTEDGERGFKWKTATHEEQPDIPKVRNNIFNQDINLLEGKFQIVL
jgi:hypothetical protein